jgi:heme exporter protein B
MITSGVFEVVFAKFAAMFVSCLLAFFISIPIIHLLYSMSLEHLWININRVFVISQTSALSVLIGSINAYFKTNTDIMSVILFPLIMPIIIIHGLMIYDRSQDLLYISALSGINFITIPLFLLASGYLLKNINNFQV